jgi:hypothetical protein
LLGLGVQFAASVAEAGRPHALSSGDLGISIFVPASASQKTVTLRK